MKTFRMVSACLAGSLLFGGYAAGADTVSNKKVGNTPINADTALTQAAKTNIPFIQNQGQVNNNEVGFYAKLFSGTLFVTLDNTLAYSVAGKVPQDVEKSAAHPRWSFRESFVNRKPSQPGSVFPSSIQASQFRGDKPGSWRQQLPVYDRTDLGEVYAGIRVALQATGNNVEKLFYVAPGANVSDIKIAVQGVQETTINNHGQLVLNTGLGNVVFTAPVAYQDINSQRNDVTVKYALADNTYGFSLGDYDPT